MRHLQNKREKAVLLAAYAIAFLLGIETGGLQFSVLKMADEFNLNSAQMGSIVSIYFFATMISPIITGGLSDKIGKKKIIIFSIVIFLTGCLVSAASKILILLYAGIFIVGLAFAALESSSTAALSDYAPEKSGKYISIMQSVLSAGCFFSPLFLNVFMENRGYSWRTLFFICMALAAISLAIVIFAKFENRHEELEGRENLQNHKPMRIEAYLMLMILCIAIYLFIENGITYFADLFISKDLNSPGNAAMALSLFWAAMAVSRFVSGFLYRFENMIIKIGFIATGLLLIALTFVNNVSLALGIYLLLGITCAPVWPLIAAKINRVYKEHTGLVTGLVLIAGGIGGTVSPYVIGLINDASSMTIAFICIAAVAMMGLVIFTVTASKKESI